MTKMGRREFIYMMAVLGTTPVFANSHRRMPLADGKLDAYYKLKPFGNVRIMHMTDCHAQLIPVYFREPSVNLGFDGNYGKPPHIVGDKFLDYYGIKGNKRLEYAYSCVNYEKHAKAMGRVGGFAQLQTIINYLRDSFGADKTLLLDGGDTWQGSWTSLQTRGKDMVGAMNELGVDVCVGHWEFTYKAKEILENIKLLDAEFLAQNIHVKEDALFDGSPSYDEESGLAFKPYTIKKMNGARVAIIGQAFPYTAIANPKRFIPDWSFGIKNDELQELVDEVKQKEQPDAIILLSHNGFDVDRKLANIVSGIDFIMGGHTHDGVPEAVPVKNANGTTYVCNAGSNGKFLNVLDLEVKKGKVTGFKFTLLPVFSDLVKEDPKMKAYVQKVREPYAKELNKVVATTDDTLYRRGNFNGSFDQVICDALRVVKGADISLSPGFRWGVTVPKGHNITFDDIATQTAITYPETYMRPMKGSLVKEILEDVADNLFNPDPFYQQGGDMVRTGGLSYTIEPKKGFGKRITNLKLSNGKTIDPSKMYNVAGWSTVNGKSDGEPIWDTVVTYLQDVKHIKNLKIDTPDMIGIKNNPGII
jgi:sulfur-oxidizing protein SoxB